MTMNNPLNIARGGVRVPENQSTEQAPVMTVTDVAPAQLVLVRYGDETGRAVVQLAVVCGNKVTVLPDRGMWTAQWKPLNSKLIGQVLDKLEAQTTAMASEISAVPPEDAVDVADATLASDLAASFGDVKV